PRRVDRGADRRHPGGVFPGDDELDELVDGIEVPVDAVAREADASRDRTGGQRVNTLFRKDRLGRVDKLTEALRAVLADARRTDFGHGLPVYSEPWTLPLVSAVLESVR